MPCTAMLCSMAGLTLGAAEVHGPGLACAWGSGVAAADWAVACHVAGGWVAACHGVVVDTRNRATGVECA